MTDPRSMEIEDLIERSSLGSNEARVARARVSRAKGEALARAASDRARRREERRRRSQG
jgi:hypothetical protein